MTKQQAGILDGYDMEYWMRAMSKRYSEATRIPEDSFVIELYFSNRDNPTFYVSGKVSKLPERWGSVSSVDFSGDKWFEIFKDDQLDRAHEQEMKIKAQNEKIKQAQGGTKPC